MPTPTTTPATPRPTRSRAGGYAKGRARRLQIIDAATELYAEQGYRGTSLRDVAARAGLSHPGLLHHFPTMEALLLAVLEHRDAEDVERFALAEAHGVEALQRLVELAEWNQARPGIVELFVVLSAEATAPDHPAHPYFTHRYELAVATTTQAFVAARGAGRLRDDVDPDVAGHRVVALMDGLQVQWLYRRDAVDMAAELRDAIDGLLLEPLPRA
ncbi:TetR/AcrR family transcriptional regulator [Luteimicrobium xylanilyticum]|uniref:Putative HTH-type transcriptional regulator n=1 Tax=Luteimicrobium xylanilyticum TaxID=1133546 RepID=A0A5P9QDL9_9MICO|nr:TetR/AcrR family transcriptional regulator [Luteimicrobium xylanilyticum]QFU99346.1 putative HTH-type transcriptional regulator [Luteimicrobium xylanilyticum]